MKKLFITSFCLIFLIASPIARSEIYSYTDDKGRKVFVDKAYKIPAKFRDQDNRRTIAAPKLSEEEQQARSLQRDLDSKKIKLRRELRKLEDTLARMETPVIIRGNQVIVPVRVNWRGSKRDLNLLLDTGASITVIHQQSVASLNAVSREQSYAQVAGGGTIRTERVVFDRMSVGPYDLDNKTTMVIEHVGTSGFDGLLGMDILGAIRYQIDFAGSKIIWSPDEYEKMKVALEVIKGEQEEMAAPVQQQ